MWGSGSVATEQAGTPEPTRVVMVAPGDTLYDIAAEATPADGDVAAMVERIQRLNALDSGMLAAGQELRIPTERLTLKTSPADSTPAGEPGKTRGGTYAVSAPRGISA